MCAVYGVGLVNGLWFKTASMGAAWSALLVSFASWTPFVCVFVVASAWLGGITGCTLSAALGQTTLLRHSPVIQFSHTLSNVLASLALTSFFVVHGVVKEVAGLLWSMIVGVFVVCLALFAAHWILYAMWRSPNFRGSYLRSKQRARSFALVSCVSQVIAHSVATIMDAFSDDQVFLAIRFLIFCTVLLLALIFALCMRSRRRQRRLGAIPLSGYSGASNIDEEDFVFGTWSSSDDNDDDCKDDDDYVDYGG